MNRITFIRPNMTDMRSSDAMEPLVFSILAGLTPGDPELSLYDERIEAVPLDVDTDLVAMTVETFTARRAYQLAAEFRRRGVPVVMGGYHPTLMPAEAGKYCDAIVIGDAEGVWERVVNDARRGCLQRVYRQAPGTARLDVRSDRGVFAGKRYAPLSLVQFGRGCRFRCDFCSIHAFYGRQIMQRPVGEVVREIESLGRKLVFFVDDNIFSNKKSAESLFQALAPLNIRWACQTSIDITRHDNLLALMEKSGCIGVIVGFETLNEQNLIQMKKKWNIGRVEYESAIRKFHDHGMMIYGTFVFGYDHDTIEAFDECVEFAIRSRFYIANFNPLTPTPGTALYNRLKREGRLLYNRWWLNPDYRYGQAIFHPAGMSAEELTDGCFRARTGFYSYRSTLARAGGACGSHFSPYKLGIFLASNWISRREILRKQNVAFGAATSLPMQRDLS